MNKARVSVFAERLLYMPWTQIVLSDCFCPVKMNIGGDCHGWHKDNLMVMVVVLLACSHEIGNTAWYESLKEGGTLI